VCVMGSALGGLAGGLCAYYTRFADPTTWGVSLTIDLVTFVVVGGMTSVYGGAAGAVLVQAMRYAIASLGLGDDVSQQVELVLTGVLLVACVLVLPGGVLAVRRPGRRAAVRDDAPSDADPARAVRPTLVATPPIAGALALVATGLTRRFGGFVAVDGVDLELTRGSITALVGPNGAGKSTVVNMLAGTLVPDAGTIRLGGGRIDRLHPDEIARLGLARTFQTPRLFAGLTVLETVMLACGRTGRSSVDRGAGAAQAALEIVGLGGLAHVAAAALTTGQQRLLDVARAIAAQPTVMLLDEPAAGLDDAETGALGELIATVASRGTAVLLVEHAMGLVMAVANRVVVLDQGRKIAEGDPLAIGRDERVVEAYLGAAIA
jgi:ABC-type branched-subunit amino acid transport system ATPase component